MGCIGGQTIRISFLDRCMCLNVLLVIWQRIRDPFFWCWNMFLFCRGDVCLCFFGGNVFFLIVWKALELKAHQLERSFLVATLVAVSSLQPMKKQIQRQQSLHDYHPAGGGYSELPVLWSHGCHTYSCQLPGPEIWHERHAALSFNFEIIL